MPRDVYGARHNVYGVRRARLWYDEVSALMLRCFCHTITLRPLRRLRAFAVFAPHFAAAPCHVDAMPFSLMITLLDMRCRR